LLDGGKGMVRPAGSGTDRTAAERGFIADSLGCMYVSDAYNFRVEFDPKASSHAVAEAGSGDGQFD
jgi:hypothetical protein